MVVTASRFAALCGVMSRQLGAVLPGGVVFLKNTPTRNGF